MDVVDRVRLGEHRARVAASLDALEGFVGYTTAHLQAHPGGRELLALDPDLLVSAALVTVAGLRGWPTAPGEFPTELAVDELTGRTVLDALRRRNLPWTPDDAGLALRAAMAGFDQTALMFALGVAKRCLEAAPGDSRVYAALTEVDRGLTEVPHHVYQVPELRRRTRALLATQAPGGLLDTSPLETTDGWGASAREAFADAVERRPELVELLGLLAEARTARPSRTWRRRVEGLVAGSADAADLVHRLLAPVVDLAMTPVRATGPHDHDWEADTWLVTPANAVILRGCALATAYVDDGWVPDLLGLLVLRGAASHPQRFVTLALCAPLASGAVDSLGLRHQAGEAAATTQLRLLADEVTRRDVLKRVHAALDVAPEQAAQRDAALAADKRRARARQADPRPRTHRADLTRLVRAEIAPALRDAGFDGVRGLTFLRNARDHQACVLIGVQRGQATVLLGVRYGAFAADDKPMVHELDVRAQLDSGQVDQHRWTWDLDLGKDGGSPPKARLLRQALVARGLVWLALHATDQGGQHRGVDPV